MKHKDRLPLSCSNYFYGYHHSLFLGIGSLRTLEEKKKKKTWCMTLTHQAIEHDTSSKNCESVLYFSFYIFFFLLTKKKQSESETVVVDILVSVCKEKKKKRQLDLKHPYNHTFYDFYLLPFLFECNS